MSHSESAQLISQGIWIYNNVINSACFSRNESLLEEAISTIMGIWTVSEGQ